MVDSSNIWYPLSWHASCFCFCSGGDAINKGKKKKTHQVTAFCWGRDAISKGIKLKRGHRIAAFSGTRCNKQGNKQQTRDHRNCSFVFGTGSNSQGYNKNANHRVVCVFYAGRNDAMGQCTEDRTKRCGGTRWWDYRTKKEPCGRRNVGVSLERLS